MLFVPVRLCVRLRATPRAGEGEARLCWLLLAFRLPLRVTALGPPPMTIALLRRDGTERIALQPGKKRRKEPGAWGRALQDALDLRQLDLSWTVGVAGDPAVAALLAGALGALTEEALAMLGETTLFAFDAARVSIYADDGRDALTLRLEGIARLRAVDIMERRWRMFVDSRQRTQRRAEGFAPLK